MKYEIEYKVSEEELAPSLYTVTCQDSEAEALMQAINKELKRMEANRIIELKHVLKEGAREQPHRQMKEHENKFTFDSFQVDDVCNAAQNLIGQQISCSFTGPTLEITAEHIENFERVIDEQVRQTA